MSKKGYKNYICIPKPLDEFERQGRENPLKDYYNKYKGYGRQYEHTMGEYIPLNPMWQQHKTYPLCSKCGNKYITECLFCKYGRR